MHDDVWEPLTGTAQKMEELIAWKEGFNEVAFKLQQKLLQG